MKEMEKKKKQRKCLKYRKVGKKAYRTKKRRREALMIMP